MKIPLAAAAPPPQLFKKGAIFIKRVITLLLICITLSGILVLPSNAATTKNITELVISNADEFWDKRFAITDIGGHWASFYIYACIITGVMQGTSTTKFNPEDNLTRAQAVQILYNINQRINAKPDYEPAPKQIFSDIQPGNWACEPAYWAKNANIINGKNTTHFYPNKYITKEEFVLMLYQFNSYMGFTNITAAYNSLISPISEYTDYKTISAKAYPAMQWACENKIIGGYNKKINPRDHLTRAQTAKIMFVFTAATVKKVSREPIDSLYISDTQKYYNPSAQWMLATKQTDYIKQENLVISVFDDLDKHQNAKMIYFASIIRNNKKIEYKNSRISEIIISGNIPNEKTAYTIARPSLMNALYFYMISESILYGIAKTQESIGMTEATIAIYFSSKSIARFDNVRCDTIYIDVLYVS